MPKKLVPSVQEKVFELVITTDLDKKKNRQITYVIYKNLLFQCKIHLKIIENSHTIISNILRKCLVIRGCFYIKTKECPKLSPSVDDTTTPAGYKRL